MLSEWKTDKHVAPPRHIILIVIQPFIELTP